LTVQELKFDFFFERLSSQAAKAKKGFLLKRLRPLTNNLPTGKKRSCFWRPVERCVIRPATV